MTIDFAMDPTLANEDAYARDCLHLPWFQASDKVKCR